MSNASNLPAPFGGMYERVPKAALVNPYCEQLENFNVTQEGISLRRGDTYYSWLNYPANSKTAYGFTQYGNKYLYMPVNNLSVTPNKVDFYLINSNSLGPANIAYSTPAPNGPDNFHFLFYNNYLFFFGETAYPGGFYFNEAAGWGPTGWTVPVGWTGPAFYPHGGAVYKSRAYLVQNSVIGDSCSYWYSGIASISGPVTFVNLNTVVSEKTGLALIAPITISDNVSTEIFLAFVCFSGEVLFYNGAYPDSASWGLIGRAWISPPVNLDAGIPYQGDYLVITDLGIVSLRDLFLKGSEQAANLTLSSNIDVTYRNLIRGIRATFSDPTQRIGYISGIWDSLNKRIIITFGYVQDDSSFVISSGSTYFILNTELKSWSYHRDLSGAAIDALVFKNGVLALHVGPSDAVMIKQKEGSSGFTDIPINGSGTGDVPFNYRMISAPIPFPKTAVYETTMIEPIMQSDLYAETNWNLIADFGRRISGSQKTDALNTNVSKPAVNVGMQNITFVQVKMSGTTVVGKTVGLNLYSYNCWYNSGETGSR